MADAEDSDLESRRSRQMIPGRMAVRALLALLLAFAAAPGGALAEQPEESAPRPRWSDRVERAVSAGDMERAYFAFVPPGQAPADGWPVVLVFHGGGGAPQGMAEMSLLHELGARLGFVTLYPAGTGRFRRRLLTWNGGYCCGYAATHRVDDIAYVRAVLADVQSWVRVDRSRVYATGMSNGALMCYRLARDLGDRFAAVAPVAAPMLKPPWRQGAPPVSIVHFHGTADDHVPYAGGIGRRSLAKVAFPPIRETMAAIAAASGCGSAPQRVELPDRDGDGQGVVRESWSGCRDESEVELYTMAGGAHSWPGGPAFAEGLIGPPNRDISASEVIWSFFSRHRRRQDGEPHR
ncbi:MAG: hypothetical protein HYV63_27630 [Candidatus Schekmanbacteria bacterium]|nr:hypothetical protein [Candidatus Schekmanbacteria bacterium]